MFHALLHKISFVSLFSNYQSHFIHISWKFLFLEKKSVFRTCQKNFHQKLAKSGQLFSETLFSGKVQHSKKMLKLTYKRNFNLMKICTKMFLKDFSTLWNSFICHFYNPFRSNQSFKKVKKNILYKLFICRYI